MEEEAGPSNTAPSRDDEAMPVVDPMLAPLGDAAEEAMRRKLKRRLKDLRRAEKAQKRAKKADKLINDPKSGLVKQKKKKKVKLKEEDAAVDGYRYDRQEANFRGEANVFDRRFFPYREVFHDQDVGRPGPSSRIQPADSPPPPERRRGPSSQVVVVKSGGVEAERWDHSGFEANRRHPPSLPPAVYRGQKPGQRKGLGSYQPRTYEEAFLVGGGPRNMTDARSFRPQERDPYYWADNPRGPASYTDYQYGNGGPPPEQRRPPPRKWEATGSSKPAPPPSATSRMPQHLRWLHERWSMYDNTLCTAKDRAGPVELAELRENSRQTNQLPLASRKQRRQMERNKTEELESRATRNHMPFYVHGEIRFGKMRTFKEFLMGQAEDVENQDRATQLYNQYKLQFRQRAFAEFFQEHSEDEWFLEKYHPVLKVGKETRRQTAVQRRLDVFMQLLVRGWMEVALERNESRKARKLLDAAIVLLEGGDEGDIACLSDLDYVLEEKKEETYTVNAESGVNGPHYSDSSSDEEEDMSGKAPGLQKTEDERASAPNEEELERAQHAKDYSYYIQERMARADDDDVPDMLDNQKLEKRTEYLGSGVFVQQVVDPKKLEEMNLHKTSAIMIRNLPAAVPRAEIEEIVSQTHGGYLRLYLSPPDTANKYLRTAIGSFWYNANIQKIVWKIRGTAIRGVQIVVIEYRDYERKIGYIDGLSGDKSVVLRDIQLCKSLIEHLDKKSRLWGSGEKGEEAPMPSDPAKAAREAPKKWTCYLKFGSF